MLLNMAVSDGHISKYKRDRRAHEINVWVVCISCKASQQVHVKRYKMNTILQYKYNQYNAKYTAPGVSTTPNKEEIQKDRKKLGTPSASLDGLLSGGRPLP
jgi:hypothetical protein